MVPPQQTSDTGLPSYGARRARLQTRLSETETGTFYVSDLLNIRYLTGFTGSNAALLMFADGDPVLLTDGRYQDQAAEQAPDIELVVTRQFLTTAVERAKGVLRAETHHLSVDQWVELGRPSSSGRLVEKLREVKDDYEIAQLRQACDISTQALAQLIAQPIAGRTEREIARNLYDLMLDHGAEDRAFDSIVAAGHNAAIPHHQPTDRVVEGGDFLKIDFGARVNGYHADCTRTFVVGSVAPWQREIYAAVRDAQERGLSVLTPGARIRSAQAAVRESLITSGWLEAFTTGLGHGVGLQIHEDPFLTVSSDARLSSRTVLTMEPGIYLPGRGGVRIEDTVLVVGEDHPEPPEILTTLTKELLEIG